MKDWHKDKVMNMANNRVINYSGTTLCNNYRNPLERCTTASQAIRLYKNCISWALQEQYPTKEDLLSFADKETLAKNGVYIDTEFNGELINNHICCVFLNCTGTIRTCLNIDKAIIPMLYFSEGSNMDINVEDNSIIPIELYYDSNVSINKPSQARIKNCNHLKAKDNIGFTDEQLSINPDMDNELL